VLLALTILWLLVVEVVVHSKVVVVVQVALELEQL
jgi:hypothetical protein